MVAPLPPLVVTGATGFLGRRLVHELLAREAAPGGTPRAVTLLVRNPAAPELPGSLPPRWRVASCDLGADAPLDPSVVPEGAVVLHLAAATGRLPTPVMQAVNVGGTRRLVEAARNAGAAHLVFVSSIAAGFANRRWYPYADAKRAAEAAVRAGGVPATIVRPTMVFGPGSPVQEGLSRLATGRLPLMLGRGRVVVQPVHVDDLVTLLLALAAGPPPGDAPVEAGGAERVTIRELLGRIRMARGLPPRRTWPVPLAIPRFLLATLESLLGPRLPVTAGQLASFLNDSTATPHPVVSRLLPSPRTLEAILAESAAVGAEPTDEPGAEFQVLARYLGTPDPGERATAAYRDAHPSAMAIASDRLDSWLVRLARRGTPACALADAYARLARPHGLLRRKLVLTLAVLESTPAWHADYDTALPAPPAASWLAIVGQGAGWVLRAGLAVILLAPVHIAARLSGTEPASG